MFLPIFKKNFLIFFFRKISGEKSLKNTFLAISVVVHEGLESPNLCSSLEHNSFLIVFVTVFCRIPSSSNVILYCEN